MEKLPMGIDVSKDKLDFFQPLTGFSKVCANNKSGWVELSSYIHPDQMVVMEATGPYYLGLAHYLFNSGIQVCVENPLSLKRFAQMRLRRTKTDKADAKLIAQYGSQNEVSIWTPSPDFLAKLRHLNSEQTLMKKMLRQICNFDHAASHHPELKITDRKRSLSTVRFIEEKLKQIENQINGIIQEHYQEQVKLLKTIPGIGPKIIATLLAVIGDMNKFEKAKNLVSYVGLCPKITQSGNSRNNSYRICKMGQGQLRAVLYMGALSAVKYNSSCEKLYLRLLEKGKPKNVALVAVAAKLLRQSYAVLKYRKPFMANNILEIK